jgi:general secretion pathway protein A
VFTPRDRVQARRDIVDTDGYERFFGLVESPFALTPNPRFLFKSRSISEALEHVTRALRRREALIVVTGEAGTGKTLLCRLVLQQLEPRTFVCVITNPLMSRDDLIRQVLTDFGVVSGVPGRLEQASGHELVRTLHQFLASLDSIHAHAVVMIDEAQHLQGEVLEQIRLLSNFETDSSKLLQIILVGQPELERVLSTPELRQLKQRISRRVELQPLGAGEVQHYIERRLWIAHGGPDRLLDGRARSFWRVQFTATALRAISGLSAGLPRVINILCDRALEVAYHRRKKSIDAAEVLSAAQMLKFQTPLTLKLASYRAVAAALLTVVTAGGVFAMGLLHTRSAPIPDGPSASAPGPVVDEASAPARAISDSSPPNASTPTGTSATVATPPATPLVAIETFSVVAASFRTPDRAAALAGSATGLGLPAFTRVVDGPWHQVVVGPYASRDEALAAQEQLNRAQIRGTRVVATQPGAE